jgi:AraC family transcriptional activator of pobA
MSDRPVVQPAAGEPPRESVFVLQQQGCRSSQAPRLVTHSFNALGFCTQGSSLHEQRGRWSVREGDVMLVPAGAAHRSRFASGASLWCVGLAPASLLAAGQAPLLEPFERVRRGESAVLSIPTERRGFVQQLFIELQRELAQRRADHERVRNSLLHLLVSEVTRARAEPLASSALPALHDDDVVGASLRFIEQHCLGPLSLRDVAAAVQRSPAHLATVLKRVTGQTVGAFILAGRMAEARRRLAHTDELVDVIAERVGYADSTHFGRLFRRTHGSTPSAFRARKRA